VNDGNERDYGYLRKTLVVLSIIDRFLLRSIFTFAETNTPTSMKKWFFIFCVSLSSLAFGQEGQGATLHSSRYIFSPSGFNLPKDSIYLNWIGPLLDVQFAPTENITLGIGTPAFAGVYVNGGYSLTLNENATAKVGALYGMPTIGQASFGLPFAVVTLGQPNANFTFGVGYGFGTGDFAGELDGVAINFAGYKDFGGKTGLLFESWYLPEIETYLIAPAFRIYTKRDRRYWNIGFLGARYSYQETDYPILGYDTNFDGVVDVTQQPSNPNYYTIYDYDNPIIERFWDTFRFPIFSYAMYF